MQTKIRIALFIKVTLKQKTSAMLNNTGRIVQWYKFDNDIGKVVCVNNKHTIKCIITGENVNVVYPAINYGVIIVFTDGSLCIINKKEKQIIKANLQCLATILFFGKNRDTSQTILENIQNNINAEASQTIITYTYVPFVEESKYESLTVQIGQFEIDNYTIFINNEILLDNRNCLPDFMLHRNILLEFTEEMGNRTIQPIMQNKYMAIIGLSDGRKKGFSLLMVKTVELATYKSFMFECDTPMYTANIDVQIMVGDVYDEQRIIVSVIPVNVRINIVHIMDINIRTNTFVTSSIYLHNLYTTVLHFDCGKSHYTRLLLIILDSMKIELSFDLLKEITEYIPMDVLLFTPRSMLVIERQCSQ